MGQVVSVNLRLVSSWFASLAREAHQLKRPDPPQRYGAHTSAHNPLAVVADSNTLTGFLELEVLQKLDAISIFGIGLETPLSLSSKPLWKRTRGRGA